MFQLIFLFAVIFALILIAGSPVYIIYYTLIKKHRVKRYSNSEPYTGKDRTQIEKVLDFIVWIICGVLVSWIFLHWILGLGIWKGKSYEAYLNRTSGKYFYFDLPEGTEDFRFRSENFGLAGRSTMALTLHGKEYDDFINDISQKYHNGSISGYLYNRELDYTGMKVSETINNYDDNGSYIGFPTEQIKYVIDDDIMDYTIIYYDYYDGAGASTKTIVTNSKTGRIVFYSFGSN